MTKQKAKAVEALIVALPESAGSAVYGLVDVFASTGTLWRQIIGDEAGRQLISQESFPSPVARFGVATEFRLALN